MSTYIPCHVVPAYYFTASAYSFTFILLFYSSRYFKEVHGHCIVPQNSGPLGGWVKMQRTAYKRFKEGEKTNMTVDKALNLSEIGFCFDASDRFKKKAV